MDLQLQSKVALVTGATAGIGEAIARELLEEGAKVVIPGRSKEKLDRIWGGTDTIQTIEADLTTTEGVETVIQNVPDIEILINNLGIYEPKPFAEITDDDWLRLFNINVMSGIRLTRHYFPKMLEKNRGRVIFIASECAIATLPEMIHYSMTKTAQLAISRGLAEMTRGTNVTVNAVMPGPTQSEGIVEYLQKMASDLNASAEEVETEFFATHYPSSLLQRLIKSEEVAHLVAYLASPLSAATNGAALRVEGGLLRSIV